MSKYETKSARVCSWEDCMWCVLSVGIMWVNELQQLLLVKEWNGMSMELVIGNCMLLII